MRSARQKVELVAHWETLLEARKNTDAAKAKALERMKNLEAYHTKALEKVKATIQVAEQK